MPKNLDNLETILKQSRWRLDPVAWAHECLGLDLDPYQKRALQRVLFDHGHLAICAGRQQGKSTITAVIAAAELTLFSPRRAMVQVVAGDLQQASELSMKVREYTDETVAQLGVEYEEKNKLSFKLESGSRIVITSSTNSAVRGRSPTLVLLDECRFIDDETFYAVEPAVQVSKGRMVAISTPGPPAGWFYDIFEGSGFEDWEKIVVNAMANPRIDQAQLEQIRQRVDTNTYQREFLAEFAADERSVFDLDDINAMFSNLGNEEYDAGFQLNTGGAKRNDLPRDISAAFA